MCRFDPHRRSSSLSPTDIYEIRNGYSRDPPSRSATSSPEIGIDSFAHGLNDGADDERCGSPVNGEGASAYLMRSGASPRGVQACPIIIRAREGHKGTFAATTRRRPSGNLRCGNRLWLTRQRKTPAKRHSMTRGGLFAGTKCPYSASRVKSWTYLWVADAKPSATQYHPGGVVLITQPPR